MTEQRQPKRWAEVVAKDEFQALEPLEQEAMRQRYFDEIVAPQTTPATYEQAWQEFDEHSRTVLADMVGTRPEANRSVDEDRTLGETVADAGKSFAAGANRMAQGVSWGLERYPRAVAGLARRFDNPVMQGVADTFERGADDHDRAQDRLGRGAEYWEGRRSPAARGQHRELGEAEGAVETLDTLRRNPALISDILAGSMPYMVPGLGSARLAQAGGAGTRGATAAAIGSGAGLEGADAAVGAEEHIRNMNEEELAQGRVYAQLIDEGASHEEAVETLVESGGNRAFLVSAPMSVLASVLTGGARMDVDLGTNTAFRDSLLKNLGRQTAEEGAQEAGNQAGQNVGVSEADERVGLLDDVDKAATLGGVMGAGQAGGGTVMNAAGNRLGQNRRSAQSPGRETRQADDAFQAQMEAMGEQMRGDFEPNAPRLAGPPPTADFYGDDQGNLSDRASDVAAEQDGSTATPPQDMPAADDWDADDGITFDEAPADTPAASVGEMAEFAGLAGVPRDRIEGALALGDEQSAVEALEDLVIEAQATRTTPEEGDTDVERGRQAPDYGTGGQPEAALRPERPDGQAPAGDSLPLEEGRRADGGTPPAAPAGAEQPALDLGATQADSAPVVATAPQDPGAADGVVDAEPVVTEGMEPDAAPQTPPGEDIDAAASEAATSPANNTPEPSDAQIEAGNYRKGHVNVQGLDISIENPRGSTRSGTDPDGQDWSVEMRDHYGYVRGTEGADTEQVDVFVGPDPASEQVFVVDQVNADGTFDEHKAMVGYRSADEARDAYAANYTDDWNVGPITPMAMDDFKAWLNEGDTRSPLRPEDIAATAEPRPTEPERPMPRAQRVRENARARNMRPVADNEPAGTVDSTGTSEQARSTSRNTERAPARRRQRQPNQRQQRASARMGGAAEGGQVSIDAQVGYSRPGTYTIDQIDSGGTVHVTADDGQGGTTWSLGELMAARRRGVAFEPAQPQESGADARNEDGQVAEPAPAESAREDTPQRESATDETQGTESAPDADQASSESERDDGTGEDSPAARSGSARLARSDDDRAGQSDRNATRRAAWPKNFPKVPFAADLGALREHRDYDAAKAGDVAAAHRVITDVVDTEAVQRIRAMVGDAAPVIVPVVASEAAGTNMLPSAFAARLGRELGLEVDGDVVQSVKVERTGQGSDYRLANHPAFDGRVVEGRSYLIVDDTMTMGGTLAALRGHIESAGGQVLGAAAVTGYGQDGQLAITEKMRQDLWRKHGEPLNDYLNETFGHGIDALTQGEAGHFRKAASVDAIRDRIAAARVQSGDQGPDGDGSTNRPPLNRSESDTDTTESPAPGRLTAGEVREVAERLRDKLPGLVNVVQSLDELPEKYRYLRQATGQSGPRGFYDPETNEVYLIADNIKDAAEAERTYLHEVVGHFGLRLALGRELNGYLDRLYKQIPAKRLQPFMDRYGLKAHRTADRRVAVEEYIAHTAELQGRKPHWFKRLVARVRDWLRSLGLVRRWTNDDIYALLARHSEPTVDDLLARSMASLSTLRRQMDAADEGVRLATDDNGRVTAEMDTDSALGMLYGFAYAGETVYPVNPGATQAETLMRHYGYEGQLGETTAMHDGREVNALAGQTPGAPRWDWKLMDTDSARPWMVLIPTPGARQGVALYQAAMDWAHNNGKKLRPDPAGLTPVNYLRRTEAMVASMARNGTSRHLEPDSMQFAGLLDESDFAVLDTDQENPGTRRLLARFKDRLWGTEGAGLSGEAVARANAHNMAAASLALTLRRKPDLLNYRVDSQGNLYEHSPNARSKPKRVAGPDTALREIESTLTRDDAANGVGARTALRAILATSALLGPNGPRDVAGAVSAITDSLALFRKGQVEKMPDRSMLPDVVIRRMARAYSPEGQSGPRVYYSFGEQGQRTVDDILNLKHQSPLARAVSWAARQGEGLSSQRYGVLTLRQLGEVGRRALPHINGYVDTVHRMMTRRNQMAEDAVEIANEVQKWASRNREEADTLFDLMHEATLAEIDPSQPFVSRTDMLNDRIKVLTQRMKGVSGESVDSPRKRPLMDELKDVRKQLKDEPRRKANHERLEPVWQSLSPGAKRVYQNMREKYDSRQETFKRLMEQRITNAKIDQHSKREMLAELRYQFESNTRGGVYFPLARFGDYWLETVDEDGQRVFTTYESARDQKRVARELRDAGQPVTSGKFLETSGQVDSASLGFVQEVIDAVGQTSLGEGKANEIGDAVYQLYLQTLPSRSMRKNFIHRKGVQGYHRDAIRTFADNMMKGSHQLARLEYQDELADQMVDMQKAAKEGTNTAAELYNEMVKRHEWVMNPANSGVAQRLTSLGFVWMLGITPAAAMVNTTQNFVVGLPVLASKMGWGPAAREIMRASGQFLSSTPGALSDAVARAEDGRAWSIRDQLKGRERDAYDDLVDMGVIDVTMAHNLAGIAETDAYRYSDTGHKVMSAVSFLFHKAEVYNRESLGLAAYRLAMDKGWEHARAVQYAADSVWDSHFDYTNSNRARFMQPNWAKVAFQFRQYSQNITYYLVRNAKRALYDPALGLFGKDAITTKEEQREAKVQLAGTLAVTFAMGGLAAMPLVGVLNWVVNALFDDDEDDPWDAETEAKQWIVDNLGHDVGEKVIWGLGGAGVSSRVTLDGLWVRDPYRDMMGEDLWTHYAQQFTGPVLGGVFVSWARGAQALSEGEPWTGAERFLPKAFKDALKAARYGTEGALTRQDYPLKEDFSFAELALQGIGIADHDLMKRYDANSAIRDYDIAIAERKSGLLNQLYTAYANDDGRVKDEVMEKIRAFNEKNPDQAITQRSIQASIRNRIRNMATTDAGMRMDRGLRTIRERITYGD